MGKGMPVPAFARPFAKSSGNFNARYARDRYFAITGMPLNAQDRCLDKGHARGDMWAADIIEKR